MMPVLIRRMLVPACIATLLRYSIALRARYAMSGTDLAYAGICLRACFAMSGTDLAYGATRLLRLVHLRRGRGEGEKEKEKEGEEKGEKEKEEEEDAMDQVISPHAWFAMSGTDLGYAATLSLYDVRWRSQRRLQPFSQARYRPIALRAPYAMSGTDTAYGAMSLRTCYAMSSTAITHTGIAYGAMRCTVLT
eukprot:3677535-Rhodomonas_salina.3